MFVSKTLMELRQKGEDVFLLEVIRRKLHAAGFEYGVELRRRRIRIPIRTDRNVEVMQELSRQKGMDRTQPHLVYTLRHLVDEAVYKEQYPVHGAQYFFVGMRPAVFKREPVKNVKGFPARRVPSELHIELHHLYPSARK